MHVSYSLILGFVKLGAVCPMERRRAFILLLLPANQVSGNVKGEKRLLYPLPAAVLLSVCRWGAEWMRHWVTQRFFVWDFPFVRQE